MGRPRPRPCGGRSRGRGSRYGASPSPTGGGRAYVFISADFDDINKLALSPAFPDLRIALIPAGDQLRLEGVWARPGMAGRLPGGDGLMAVRFHLPSKVYAHKNAVEGVERGNIVSWRQEVAAGLGGEHMDFGAVMDSRSILRSTLTLFAGALALATVILGGGLYLVARQGRKRLAASAPSPPS